MKYPPTIGGIFIYKDSYDKNNRKKNQRKLQL